MIEIKNITKEYQTKHNTIIGVDNVSMSIRQGEIYGIVGYSGAGKSTLLRCLNLLEQPTSGTISIDGQILTNLSAKQVRKARQKIGMIFQNFHLVSAKTVYENVEFALKAANTPVQDREKRVLDLLNMVGLEQHKDHYPAQLSGGQKQRVGVARALANNPHVLLCDEATSALDPTTTRSILKLLQKINQELGITIVLITHEMEVVKEICHRVAVMQDGKVVEEGQVYDIFANPQNALTTSFIESVLQFSLPDKITKGREGVIVKLQFKGDVAEEAIVSDMLQSFLVKGNILHGKIEYIQDTPLGIFVMELTGEPEDVQQAMNYLQNRLLKLEVLHDAA
ncbi:methionine ABC transporter ATP-binding protein [Pontibacillus salicampi]|uniref:Methionine ABC transporter ATP-binding protein n=1 Tax=Pontibacillus salicampi TaxID=1449801 RepID=A0ABV6LT68_9BACI